MMNAMSPAADLRRPEGGLPDLEREEEERDPDDGPEDGELHDELVRPVAVHGLRHGHADDERAGERGQGEAGDGPADGSVAAAAPDEEHPAGAGDGLGDDVGVDGAVVGVRGTGRCAL